MTDWVEARTVGDLYPAGATQSPATRPPPLLPPSPQWQPPQALAYQGVYPPGYTSSPPPNYLVQAILVTVFCCLPFGIVSIVYAAQVNGKHQGGDHVGAMESSGKAKFWCWMAFGFGLAPMLVWLFVVVIGGVIGGVARL
jgi:hypothetical protein